MFRLFSLLFQRGALSAKVGTNNMSVCMQRRSLRWCSVEVKPKDLWSSSHLSFVTRFIHFDFMVYREPPSAEMWSQFSSSWKREIYYLVRQSLEQGGGLWLQQCLCRLPHSDRITHEILHERICEIEGKPKEMIDFLKIGSLKKWYSRSLLVFTFP